VLLEVVLAAWAHTGDDSMLHNISSSPAEITIRIAPVFFTT
jgi:hypothetical protein